MSAPQVECFHYTAYFGRAKPDFRLPRMRAHLADTVKRARRPIRTLPHECCGCFRDRSTTRSAALSKPWPRAARACWPRFPASESQAGAGAPKIIMPPAAALEASQVRPAPRRTTQF